MEAMGFPRSEIDRAMRAAFFNPDRAVEYLLNGIPESALREQAAGAGNATAAVGAGAQAPPANPSDTANDMAAGAGESTNLFDLAAQTGSRSSGGPRGATVTASGESGPGGTGAAPNFEFLRSNPQFQQLRQVVQQQPQMLEPILQQVAAGNPQVAQLISQHPEQFMQLLAEDVDEDAPMPAGAQQIAVSEEEREAIERVRLIDTASPSFTNPLQLCRLGFERDMAIQAYFACDKNEELAANFLFDQPDEAEEQ